ncbi:MAG: hypothetical protein AMXMBFR58_29700 [Phycisphaerae bacterium]
MEPLDVTGLLNIPYRDGGRGHDGVDCYGLVRLALQRVGVNLPSEPVNLTSGQAFFNAIEPDKRVFPGDLLILNRPGVPTHAAIVVDGTMALHATAESNSRLDRVDLLRRAYRVEIIARPKAQ